MWGETEAAPRGAQGHEGMHNWDQVAQPCGPGNGPKSIREQMGLGERDFFWVKCLHFSIFPWDNGVLLLCRILAL